MQFYKSFTVFVVLFLLTATGFAQSQDPPSEEELKLRIVERQYTDVSDKQGWEIDAKYPEVRLKGDKPAEEFNNKAKALVMEGVERFKKQMAEDFVEPRSDQMYYLSVEYAAEYFDHEIVSIRFAHSEDTGGAHPNHWTYTINYDLVKNKPIELSNVFESKSNYLNILSRYSIDSLQKQIRELTESDNLDGLWFEDGAGPKADNFKNWNATKEGLLVTFDPYQVGPYVIGGFEVVIPYRIFPTATRGAEFYSLELKTYINWNPPNYCRGGLWTSGADEFGLAVVKGSKNTRAYFHTDDGNCPDGENCRAKAYLVAGDEVIVQREFEGFSCVWYKPAKGPETVGWIRSSEIESRPDISRPPRIWTGKWSYAENEIEIKESPSGKYHVYGTAIWKGMGDNVHVGEIDYLGVPTVDRMEFGEEDEYGCRVQMTRLGKYLIVSDNLNCGGANVSFNGVYTQQK